MKKMAESNEVVFPEPEVHYEVYRLSHHGKVSQWSLLAAMCLTIEDAVDIRNTFLVKYPGETLKIFRVETTRSCMRDDEIDGLLWKHSP